MKKREVAGDTGGADWPTQPPKKLKTEEMTLPAAQPEVVNNYGWRGDTSKMFSCSLCQYHTPDEEQIMEHFNSSEHKDILKHLFIFFPQHRLDFLQEYFLYVKEEMSMQQKNSDMPPIRDKFKGIGQEHYLHRIQAAHCRACELLIPDVPELLTAHITSPTHKENCKTTFRTIKINSYAVAKELFLDEKILEMLKIYSQKQKPIKEIVACLSQVNSTDYDVLVAEEDDDDDSSDEDAIANPVVPCDRNEDSIAEAKADPEVRGNRNEDSITEAKADPEVPGNHNEGSIAEAKADPEVPGNHNEGSIAEAKAHPEAPATHKEHAIADAKAHPEVPGNRNEDVIAVEKVDAKVPIIHKQGPAHENKGHPGSIVPCPPMNIPKNMPSSSTVNPQLIPKSKMTNPDLTNYNRFRVQNDFQFAENFDLDEDAFLVGSYGLEFTKKIGPTYRYHAEQKGTPPLLHQGGKKKNKDSILSPTAAAKHAKKQQVINQPQSSGAAAKNQQKQQVLNRPQSSGTAAKNPQKQQVINQPQSSGVRAGQNPQQPTPPAVCHPASSKTQTKTQIGDMKKSEAAGKNSGATGSTPPNQKLNTSNPSQFKETPKNVKNDRWRVGLSHMYSCGLCEYRTPDDYLIKTHVKCFLHKQIRSYLCNFFTKQKVDFLNKYIVYKRRKTAMQRKMLNIQSLDDQCAGIGTQHFLHRVQVVHCQACDVLIPDVRAHYASHVQFKGHRKKRKAMAKDIKLNSVAVAKRLFQNYEVCQLLKAYELGNDPFQHLPVCESQVSSTGEVQADDVDIDDEDSIADSDDSEVPAHETQGSHNKKFPPVEPDDRTRHLIDDCNY
ncbi:uncharacterized protein [Eleutherodactylus coqui]|uniref:uncharacterized protein isoform X3 n=1 Tax=Eleutherodactylus coqui TaxID=57060 RepID=UPI0034618404